MSNRKLIFAAVSMLGVSLGIQHADAQQPGSRRTPAAGAAADTSTTVNKAKTADKAFNAMDAYVRGRADPAGGQTATSPTTSVEAGTAGADGGQQTTTTVNKAKTADKAFNAMDAYVRGRADPAGGQTATSPTTSVEAGTAGADGGQQTTTTVNKAKTADKNFNAMDALIRGAAPP